MSDLRCPYGRRQEYNRPTFRSYIVLIGRESLRTVYRPTITTIHTPPNSAISSPNERAPTIGRSTRPVSNRFARPLVSVHIATKVIKNDYPIYLGLTALPLVTQEYAHDTRYSQTTIHTIFLQKVTYNDNPKYLGLSALFFGHIGTHLRQKTFANGHPPNISTKSYLERYSNVSRSYRAPIGRAGNAYGTKPSQTAIRTIFPQKVIRNNNPMHLGPTVLPTVAREHPHSTRTSQTAIRPIFIQKFT